MLNTAEKMIEKVDYFGCGYCTNDLKKVFKDFEKTIVDFYAGVFLIKHRKMGYILYDTGYSMEILKNNPKYFLYRFANPITLKREDMIDYQLKEKGIDNNLKSGKDNLLIFNELFPDDFENRLILIKDYKENKLFPYKESFDLFSDSSMLMIEVDGHAKGQGCLFLPEKNLLIAADVCWGTEYLPLTDKMKRLARKIQNNFEDYKQGSDLLKKVMKNDISVIVSHDNKEKIKRILNEKNI